ncbi:hypothetical protein A3D70_00980 [Candidatus Adlerbacteria bacterium RIFCSPHIGHO2_02_FULL_54_18]|uniref:Type II secretion system protein GspG C-terminal domain-containing protein n=2 Tax=Candidatus Adleribacteriota TaxID=1752736 RepID=A0A1F4Y338_9BACT|nr:MAG: hypothetical protein A2949_01295 [Candidatus Adlerbacteria bacterium RIFCSPLOWO2_01_FULL_54_21b]OGC88268.1 MAG: hypothetical protein A3D70_00980 [Candidatus Adlerbacteria bacterium RIFCSPHIGHO2_02_FULL_54_18]
MKKGFTLIELLVVIGIIAILASVVTMSARSSLSKARDVRRVEDIQVIMGALELYNSATGHYPISTGCGSFIPYSWPGGNYCNSWHNPANGYWIYDNGVNVLSKYIQGGMPRDPLESRPLTWDPLGGGAYYYFSDNGKGYFMVFQLENSPNPLELQDGVYYCGSNFYHYGDNANGIITVGASC